MFAICSKRDNCYQFEVRLFKTVNPRIHCYLVCKYTVTLQLPMLQSLMKPDEQNMSLLDKPYLEVFIDKSSK